MATQVTNKDWTTLVKDTLVYGAKSLASFLLAIIALLLTAIAWVSSGLSVGFGKLTEVAFVGARYLKVQIPRFRIG